MKWIKGKYDGNETKWLHKIAMEFVVSAAEFTTENTTFVQLC